MHELPQAFVLSSGCETQYTTGMCSEVARFVQESKTEKHYLEERLMLYLFLKAEQAKEVRTPPWLV
jgi:hypothetical protein